MPVFGPGPLRSTRRFGSLTGSRRTRSWSSRLKIAVFAPMPRASVAITTSEKPGLLRRSRNAWRTSWTRRSMAAAVYKLRARARLVAQRADWLRLLSLPRLRPRARRLFVSEHSRPEPATAGFKRLDVSRIRGASRTGATSRAEPPSQARPPFVFTPTRSPLFLELCPDRVRPRSVRAVGAVGNAKRFPGGGGSPSTCRGLPRPRQLPQPPGALRSKLRELRRPTRSISARHRTRPSVIPRSHGRLSDPAFALRLRADPVALRLRAGAIGRRSPSSVRTELDPVRCGRWSCGKRETG